MITVTLSLVVLRLIHSLVRNHRIDSTSQVQAYYHYHDDPGSASESSSIYFRRLTYSKCPLVFDDVIITSAAHIEEKYIKKHIGDNVFKLWLDELRQDTKQFENSRSCRGVICNPGRHANVGALIVNTFAGGPFDRFLPKDLSAAYAVIVVNMDKVTPVLEFVHTVHADDDQPTFDYIMNWLTKMVGRREKMKTALLFFGPKGAGKDIIF